MPNDFNVDLEYSLEGRENEMFDLFYYRVFSNLKNIEIVDDLDLQKKGIDKILTFKNGNQIFIDEKKRRRDYGDILLEEYSVVEKKKVGWINPNSHTDYIVYAIMPSKKVYLLPFIILRLAFKNNYINWKRQYGIKEAINNGYTTSNIPVPIDVLFSAMEEQMKKQLIK